MNIQNKLLPQSIDLERSILSSILIDPDTLNDVVLVPEDFYKPQHRVFFKVILELQEKNQPIELPLIVELLKAKNALIESDGLSYIIDITESPYSPNIEYYCNIIKEKANLRKLIKVASKAVADCHDPTQSPTTIIEKTKQSIFEIGTEQTGLTDIKSILSKNINTLEMLSNKNNKICGLPTGFKYFDIFTSGLHKSDFILIGARPSMGKTTFAMNIVRNVASNLDPVLVFSLEMSKEQLAYRLISDIGDINSMKFKNGNLNNDEWEKINSATSQLYDLPIHIVDSSGLKIEQILSISRNFKRKHDISLIMIDYVQLINGWNKEGQGVKAEISRSLKLLAKSLNIPVIALSQLNRALESRIDKRPMMSDLREAGALEQDADIITFLFRKEIYETSEEKQSGINLGKAELLIRKNRNGATGRIDLKFIPEFSRFESLNI